MTSIHTLYSDDTALPSADLPYLLRCVDAALGCLFSSKSAVGSNLTGLVSCKALSFTGVLMFHCKMLYICSKMHDPAPPHHHLHHNWEHSINGATHLLLEHVKPPPYKMHSNIKSLLPHTKPLGWKLCLCFLIQ